MTARRIVALALALAAGFAHAGDVDAARPRPEAEDEMPPLFTIDAARHGTVDELTDAEPERDRRLEPAPSFDRKLQRHVPSGLTESFHRASLSTGGGAGALMVRLLVDRAVDESACRVIDCAALAPPAENAFPLISNSLLFAIVEV